MLNTTCMIEFIKHVLPRFERPPGRSMTMSFLRRKRGQVAKKARKILREIARKKVRQATAMQENHNICPPPGKSLTVLEAFTSVPESFYPASCL